MSSDKPTSDNPTYAQPSSDPKVTYQPGAVPHYAPYPQEILYAHRPADDDEIDLLALFDGVVKSLWQRKWLIIIVALIGFVGAYLSSYLMSQRWVSTAEVVAPRLKESVDLVKARRQLALVTASDNQIDIGSLTHSALQKFLFVAANYDEKMSFLAQTDYYQQRLRDEVDEGDTINEIALLEDIASGLTIEVPREPKEDEPVPSVRSYSTTFAANEPEAAQAVLRDYLAHINRMVMEETQFEFLNQVESLIDNRQWRLSTIELQLQQERELVIERYAEALLTAQKAGIKSARDESLGRILLELNHDGSSELYLRGEEVLTALLEVAKTEPLSYPLEYYRLKFEVEALAPILELNPEFTSFTYIKSPNLPVRRDSPQRAKMAIIGGLIGGFLALFYVLGAAALRNRSQRELSESVA